MAWRYAVAQAGQKRDLGLKIAWNPANAGQKRNPGRKPLESGECRL
jgi:hypothetical protein